MLCGSVFLAGWVVAWLADFSSASIKNTDAFPIENRAPSFVAVAAVADAPQAVATEAASIAKADVATTADAATPADEHTASDNTGSIAEVALADAAPTPPADLPPSVQVATLGPPALPSSDAKATASSIETVDTCVADEICVDEFLWTIYQRTPKEDTIKVVDKKKVKVKKKGKTVTVTKSTTRLVDQDFTWKDPKAAEKRGMPMKDYVIGGMDRDFKLKLFHMLYAADQAGLSPGITSAFRDDYRQSIASGLKAANDRSYHGGSSRGGYGRGLAADLVSTKGATRAQRWVSTESFWTWIDAHGKEFGIGRPYLDHDPPHVAPIDGKEYADHHRGTKAQAKSNTKKRSQLAMRKDKDRSAAKAGKKTKVASAKSTAHHANQRATSPRRTVASLKQQ